MWFEPNDISPVEQCEGSDIEELLLTLSERAFSGIAQHARGERTDQILFEEGFIFEVLTRPSRDEEQLGTMLRLGEQISGRDLERARERADQHDRTLRAVLWKLEILEREHIRQAATSRLTYLLHQLCDVSGGRTELYQPSFENLDASLPPSELRAHVAPEQVVFRRRFERFSQLEPEEWEAMIDMYGGTYPRRVEGTSGRLERSFSEPSHRELGEHFIDGRHRFEQIITHSPLPPGETIAVLSALRSMELVDFRTTAMPELEAERFGEIVETKHLSVHKASYFEVLNIHWSSYNEVTDAAFETLRNRYDTERLPDEVPLDILQKAGEIADRVEKAYEVLKYRETRHKYRQKIMPDYKLEHALPLLLRKAELAHQRGQLELARDALRRVLELEPNHVEATSRLEDWGE